LNQGNLNLERQGGREAVHIDFICLDALWLKEYLVAHLVSEADHLVFDRRTVAWANATDHPRIQRRPVQIVAYDLSRRFCRVGDIAWKLSVNPPEYRSNRVLFRMFHMEHSVLGLLNGLRWTIRMFHVEQILHPMREVGDRIVTLLDFRLREINRSSKQARGGTCLESAELQSDLHKRG